MSSINGLSRTTDVSLPEGPAKVDVTGAAPVAATVSRAPSTATGRADVQRLLLEKSAPPPDVAAPAAGNAALRAAFDKIDVPASEAKTYRLDRNVEAFASKWKMMEGAKKSIDTTYFFCDDDIFGYAYLGTLLKKAKEGASVRVMMDDTGNRGGKGLIGTGRDKDLLQELVNVDPKRVQVAVYNPLLNKAKHLFGGLDDICACDHDKLLITDGKTVETGGRNIGGDYFSDPDDKKGVFRDTDMHMESPVAAESAKKAFEREFNDNDAKKIKKDLFGNWEKHDAELMGAHLMMDAWIKAPPLSDAEKANIRSGGNLLQKYADEALAKALADLPKNGVDHKPSKDEMKTLQRLARDLVSNTEVRGAYNVEPKPIQGEVKLLDRTSSINDHPVNETSDALISLIDNAKDSITIHNPYVVMTDRAIDALAAAGKRGVKIDIITNSPVSTDSYQTQAFFLEDWPLILAKIPNAHILVATGDQKQHSKTFVIDGELTGVSTFNADWLSARVNSEDVALNWGKDFADDTLKSYDKLLKDPRHAFVEYKIKRDEQGRALVKDGKPIVEFGPENHCPKEVLDKINTQRKVLSFARDHLDALAPLRRPTLDPAKDPIHVIP